MRPAASRQVATSLRRPVRMQEWRLTPVPASHKFEAAGPHRADAGRRIKHARFATGGQHLPKLLGYLAYPAWRSWLLIWFANQVRAASAVCTAMKRASGISARGLAEAISRATSAISIQSLSLPSPRCANALHAMTLAQ